MITTRGNCMEKSKFFTTTPTESDARSESDALSRRSSGSEVEEEEDMGGDSGRNASFFRKRSKPEDGSSSDAEKGSARKIPTSGRGAGRATGRGRGDTSQEAAERAKRLAEEGRHPGATNAAVDPSGQSGSERDDSAEEARKTFGEMVVAALRDMGRKREKTSKEKTVHRHAASLQEAFDVALEKSVAKLRAELRSELRAELQAELAAVRRADSQELGGGGRKQGQGQSQPQSQLKPQPQVEPGSQLLTLVQRELAASQQQLHKQLQEQQQQFQLRIQQQLSLLEGIVLRPPLAATSGQKAASYATAAAAKTGASRAGLSGQARSGTVESQPARPAPQARQQQQRRPAPAAAPKKGKAAPATKVAGAPAVVANRRTVPPPQPAEPPAEAEWQVAGAKKRAGRANRAAKKRQRRQRRKRMAGIRAPRSTAVVITLQPEAAKKGATYGQVIRKARQAVDLNEFGITGGFRMRHTATGALMLEVPGANSGPTADALAEKIRATLDAEEARVSRPTRCVDMRIMGLDDSVTAEEVVAAVARTGGCLTDQVRAGAIRADGTGMGAVTVNCPVSAARIITGEGQRLLVGWVSARVKLLEPRPLRCYRCHVGHHVGVCCAAEEDRSDHCFQCGQSGHKAETCNAAPHCYACAAAGKPADHRAGSRTCDPPAKAKGKVPRPVPAKILTAAAAQLAAAAIASADAAAATTAAGPSQRAREETVMDCQ